MIISKGIKGAKASGLVGLWDYLKWEALHDKKCFHFSAQNQNERIAIVPSLLCVVEMIISKICGGNDHS